MAMFDPNNRSKSDRHKQAYALTEIAYTAIDFLAAALFVIGSLLFFREETTTVATWLFLIGSVFFGVKPTIRLLRELYYLHLDRLDAIISDERPGNPNG